MKLVNVIISESDMRIDELYANSAGTKRVIHTYCRRS